MAMGRAIRAGAAYVELTVNDSKLQKGLKAAQARLMAFGSVTRSIGAAFASLGAGAAVGLFPAIQAASQMQDTMNKFRAVFGEQSDAVQQWADDFAKQIGRGKRQIRSFLAESQDLFVPLGFDRGAAAELSKTITGLAVDLASFNEGMADEDAIRDLKAALTGSGEVMKKYGVNLSEAAVQQQLLNQQIDPKRASDQQKVMARLAIIMAGTTDAQGDAARSAGDFSSQMKALKGQAEDAAAAIGAALLPVVTPLVGKLRAAAEMVSAWAERNPELVATVLKVVATATAAGAALFVLGGAASAVGSIFGLLGGILATAGTALGAIGTVVAALLSPIGLVTTAVLGLGAAWVSMSGTGGAVVDWLRGKFGVLMDDALNVFGVIRDALASGQFEQAAKVLWTGLKLAWTRGVAFLRQKWAEFKTAFLKIATDAWFGAAIVLNNAWAGLEKAWVETTAVFSKAWSKFVGFVLSSWNTISGAIRKAWAKVKATVKGTDATAEIQRIENETRRRSEQLESQTAQSVAAAEQERQRRRAQIERDRAGANTELVGQADAINARRKREEDQAVAAAEADVAKARAELAASIADVDRTKVGVGGDDGPDGAAAPDLQKALASIGGGTLAAEKEVQANTGAVLGTDEGTRAVLAALRDGGMDPAERTAEQAKKIAGNTQKMRAEMKELNAQIRKAPPAKVERA